MTKGRKEEPKLGKIKPISELPERKRDYFDWPGFFAKIPSGHFAEVEGINKFTLRRKVEKFGDGNVKVVLRRDADGNKHVYLVRKE